MNACCVIHSQRVVFDDFFKVVEAEVGYERPDGTMSEVVRRLSLERGDSAAVVVLDVERRMILLTRQFRYPAHAYGDAFLIELVAGGVKLDEEPELAARRELEEELGYRVPSLTPISTFYVSPGGSSERIHLFYAEVDLSMWVSAGGGLAEENEDIEVVLIPVDDVPSMLSSGEFVDAKTIIGLSWLVSDGGHRIVKSLAREPVNPSPPCMKCANTDVVMSYCDGCSKRLHSYYCQHGDVEHFHRHCRSCSYDWVTHDAIDAVVKCKERRFGAFG